MQNNPAGQAFESGGPADVTHGEIERGHQEFGCCQENTALGRVAKPHSTSPGNHSLRSLRSILIVKPTLQWQLQLRTTHNMASLQRP
ncbi:uncharacterized protein LMH87_008362 [Akanthomyces muscarius]|uniref:Uncharacterized protein n=1 Tax=Akanthomyces muscarius TaxID=2231603 RepID=A0A9W8QL06_AKAMU|nr:uncharacterized protein LMH87_008362 [Akanthomyces muscarius]KAJ4159462.1 hypothetical protein LMH87_008362 [Akanthomyces muscarius]